MTTTSSGGGPRERIVRAGARWFARRGFQAVGVDMIVEKSGVAKMTLYRYFESKDDLIEAVLNREDGRLRTWLADAAGQHDEANAKVIAWFAAIEALTAKPACTGCLFQLAVGEFPDTSHIAHATARRHKSTLRAWLLDAVAACGITSSEETADRLFWMMEGAWASARLGASTTGLARAARMLLEAEHFVQSFERPDRSTKSD